MQHFQKYPPDFAMVGAQADDLIHIPMLEPGQPVRPATKGVGITKVLPCREQPGDGVDPGQLALETFR